MRSLFPAIERVPSAVRPERCGARLAWHAPGKRASGAAFVALHPVAPVLESMEDVPTTEIPEETGNV